MLDEDDGTLSETTASSSGIPNCDVTVLGHESISSLIGDVEKSLKKKGYTVAFPRTAGRPVQENLISRVKHAAICIIILTKQTAKNFQSLLEALPPLPNSGSLHNSTTLILSEKGLKRIRPVYKNIIRLILGENATKVSAQISSFIEAQNLFMVYELSKSTSFKEFHTSVLINSIINPRQSMTPLKINFFELQDRFEKKFGLFRFVFPSDSAESIKEYIKQHEHFKIENDTVEQTDTGALLTYSWAYNIENSASLKAAANDGIGMKGLRETLVSSSLPVTVEEASTESNNQHAYVYAEARASQWVVDSTNSRAGVEPTSFDVDWEKLDPLRKCLYEFDSRYSFFLISGMSGLSDKVQGTTNIPWLKVFDFDVNSRKTGLLSSVEATMKNYSISTFGNATKPPLNGKTDWFFPLGFSSKQDTIFDCSPLSWYTKCKEYLEGEFYNLSNFCALRTMPIFVILWYNVEDVSVNYLRNFLSILYPAFTSDTLQKKVILCTDQESSNNVFLNDLIEYFELSATTILIQPEDVFKYFAQVKVPERSSNDVMKLPKAKDGEKSLDVVEIPKDNVWITDYIEVLSLESQDEIKQRETKDSGVKFVRGNTITWDELAANTIAVQREARDSVYACLQKDVLEERKSIILKILHAPGGGGTTFARQILWDLHTKVPCGVVVPKLTLSVIQLMESVRFLHDHTLLPVVLLVDGRSDYEVEQLYENSKYAVVILHVQRCNKDIPKAKFNSISRTCYLPGSVTPTEAKQLTEVFSKFSSQSAYALSALTSDVSERGRVRFIFEYGLTAFNHEFKGVRKYVHGYLKIEHHTERIKTLQSWQKVIAYLSLVLYYGQNGLHRETFNKLLREGTERKGRNVFVSLQDLEYEGRQFILETKEDWKISYNVVAKEILEQILAPSVDLDQSGNKELTPEAKCNLHELVIDFIMMIKRTLKGGHPEPLVKILTDMVLRRDYIDMDMEDGFSKRYMLSKLLEQIPVTENRIEILRQLTYTFPKYTEFHAHLGRLLNIVERFDEAVQSLQKALNIRIKEREGMLDSTDDVQARIHNMFGNGYLRQAKIELKNALGSSSVAKLIGHVKEAVSHFSAGRRYATRNLSFGYIGEVRSRLLIAEYVHKRFKNGCRRAFDNQLGRQYAALSEHVVEAHAVCDQLLAECCQHTPDVELKRIYDYRICIETFNECFSDIKGDMPLWSKVDTSIPIRRSQIASLKMTYHKRENKHCPSIDYVTEKQDVVRIIQLYEKTFQEVFSGNLTVSVSVDVREWLDTIRHNLADDKYSLNTVLQTFSDWNRKNEGSLATYYLYVVNFILSIFHPGHELNMSYYDRAVELRKRMQMHKYKTRIPHWKFEWLANHNILTVRKMISSNKLGQWEKEKRFWKEPDKVEKLQVCTGTIVKSLNPLMGSISVDVPSYRQKFRNRIEVYFVPKLYNLCGARYAEKSLRVEFCVGFSTLHGAEAFSVKPMEKHFCKSCRITTETLTINAGIYGKCMECGFPHDK